MNYNIHVHVLMNNSLLLPYVLYVIYYYVLSNTDQAEH